MANEVIFDNVQVLNCSDTEANWSTSTYVPGKGELIIYLADENYSYDRFKFGDGTTVVTELPFANKVSMEIINNIKYYGDPFIVPSSADFFEYTVIEDEVVSIDSYKHNTVPSDVTKIVVPYEIEGKLVTSFNANLVTEVTLSTQLTDVILPKSIKQIGNAAFATSNKIKKVEIPDEVTSIGSDAFRFSRSIEYVEIPESVTSIGDTAFCAISSDSTVVRILSDNVVFGTDVFKDSPNVTIICNSGSTAEAYAKANDIKYSYNTIDSSLVDKQFEYQEVSITTINMAEHTRFKPGAIFKIIEGGYYNNFEIYTSENNPLISAPGDVYMLYITDSMQHILFTETGLHVVNIEISQGEIVEEWYGSRDVDSFNSFTHIKVAPQSGSTSIDFYSDIPYKVKFVNVERPDSSIVVPQVLIPTNTYVILSEYGIWEPILPLDSEGKILEEYLPNVSEDYIIDVVGSYEYNDVGHSILTGVTCDIPYSEIRDEYRNGKNLKLAIIDDRYGTNDVIYAHLTETHDNVSLGSEYPSFTFTHTDINGYITSVSLGFSRSGSEYWSCYVNQIAHNDLSNVSTENFTAKVNEAFPDGIGEETFVVSVSYDKEFSYDAYYEDILQAYSTGKQLVLHFTGDNDYFINPFTLYPCISASEDEFVFGGYVFSDTVMYFSINKSEPLNWKNERVKMLTDDFSNVPKDILGSTLGNVLPYIPNEDFENKVNEVFPDGISSDNCKYCGMSSVGNLSSIAQSTDSKPGDIYLVTDGGSCTPVLNSQFISNLCMNMNGNYMISLPIYVAKIFTDSGYIGKDIPFFVQQGDTIESWKISNFMGSMTCNVVPVAEATSFDPQSDISYFFNFPGIGIDVLSSSFVVLTDEHIFLPFVDNNLLSALKADVDAIKSEIATVYKPCGDIESLAEAVKEVGNVYNAAVDLVETSVSLDSALLGDELELIANYGTSYFIYLGTVIQRHLLKLLNIEDLATIPSFNMKLEFASGNVYDASNVVFNRYGQSTVSFDRAIEASDLDLDYIVTLQNVNYTIPAGMNIVYTAQGLWDMLSYIVDLSEYAKKTNTVICSTSATNATIIGGLGASVASGVRFSVVLGNNATTSKSAAIAIGREAKVTGAANSIQLGGGENSSTSATLQVWNHTLLDKTTGKIPAERLPDIETTSTYVVKTEAERDAIIDPSVGDICVIDPSRPNSNILNIADALDTEGTVGELSYTISSNGIITINGTTFNDQIIVPANIVTPYLGTSREYTYIIEILSYNGLETTCSSIGVALYNENNMADAVMIGSASISKSFYIGSFTSTCTNITKLCILPNNTSGSSTTGSVIKDLKMRIKVCNPDALESEKIGYAPLAINTEFDHYAYYRKGKSQWDAIGLVPVSVNTENTAIDDEVRKRVMFYDDSEVLPTSAHYFEYEIQEIEDDTATDTLLHRNAIITGLSEDFTDSELVIPYEIEGATVTFIASNAFANNSNIASVVLPNTITSTGTNVFASCTNLISVRLSDNLQAVSNSAFLGCTNLTSIRIPSSVQIIANNAFGDCTNLTSVIFDPGVTTIAGMAFRATGLTSVILPDSLTTVENVAFAGCTSLENIIVPNSLVNIDENFLTGVTNCTVNCYAGSAIETYAKEKNIPIRYLSMEDPSISYVEIGATGAIEGTVKAPLERIVIPGSTRNSYNLFDGSTIRLRDECGISVTYDVATQEFTFNGTVTGTGGQQAMFTWTDIDLEVGAKYRLISEYSGTVTYNGTAETPVNLLYLGSSTKGDTTNSNNWTSIQMAGSQFGENISGTSRANVATATYNSVNAIWFWLSPNIEYTNFKVKLMLSTDINTAEFEPYDVPVHRKDFTISIDENINCINVPHNYTFIGSANLTDKCNLKAGTEYVCYCDESYNDADGKDKPVLVIGGNSIKNSTTSHNLPSAEVVKFTPTADNPVVAVYSNGWNGSNSAGVTGTIKGLRIYEAKYDPTAYEYQEVTIPYELAEGEYIEAVDGVVSLHKEDSTTDITTTDTGTALLALYSNYPSTTIDGFEADVQVTKHVKYAILNNADKSLGNVSNEDFAKKLNKVLPNILDSTSDTKVTSGGGFVAGRDATMIDEEAGTGVVIGNGAHGGNGIVLGSNAEDSAGTNIVIGNNASLGGTEVANGIVIGHGSSLVGTGIVVGDNATVSSKDSNGIVVGIETIQLGTGTNESAGTFQVWDYQVLDANGYIPQQRFKPTTVKTITEEDTQNIENNVIIWDISESPILSISDEVVWDSNWTIGIINMDPGVTGMIRCKITSETALAAYAPYPNYYAADWSTLSTIDTESEFWIYTFFFDGVSLNWNRKRYG